MTDFGVETIELDLPALVGALSRRLHERGLPVTPVRSAEFARALTLVRPVSRRRLYWTARAVFVSDPAHPVPYIPRPDNGEGWSTWLVQDQRFVDNRPDVLTCTP